MDPRTALDLLKRPAGETSEAPSSVRPDAGSRLGAKRRYWPHAAAIGIAALVLAGVGAGLWVQIPRPIAVTTVEVEAEGADAASLVTASGTVVAQMQATIAAQVTGMVAEVYVREGDRVAKGQIVARLDERTAAAGLLAARAQWQAANAQATAFAALAERDRRDVARKRALADAQAVSASEYEMAEAQYRYDLAMAETYRKTAAQYRQTYAIARIQRDYSTIRAPFAGVVTERYAHPGEMISPQAVGGFTQTGICALVDMNSLEVDVDVGEALIARLKPQGRATIVLDAFAQRRFKAHVLAIVPTANQQKGTVKVRVAFDEEPQHVLPQMNAQVWFEGESAPIEPGMRLYLPQTAIRRDADGPFVFLVSDDTVRKVPVRLTADRQNRVRILSGLQAGARVVTSSQAELSDGRKVKTP